MKTFLSLVASDVLDYYGPELSDVLFILPNKRSSARFKEEIALQINVPLWTPEVFAMNDWIIDASDYSLAGEFESMMVLFQAVSKHWGIAGSVREFLSWGDMLKRDFDEVDKYLVDASRLYVQLSDEKEIESRFSILGKEEIQQLSRFWKGINNKPSDLQIDWLSLWNKLFVIFEEYHNVLQKNGRADTGMMYRDLADEALSDPDFLFSYSGVCFIGFNALTKTEKVIFAAAHNLGKGRFYWDAIEHLAKYSKDFPPPDSFRSMDKSNNSRFDENPAADFLPVRLYSFESSIGQVKMVNSWLDDTDKDASTAIVLGEEGMLDELLWALDQKQHRINISIGSSVILTKSGRLFLTLADEIVQAVKDGRKQISLPDSIIDAVPEYARLILGKDGTFSDKKNFLELKSWVDFIKELRESIHLFTSIHDNLEVESLDIIAGMLSEIADVNSNYKMELSPEVWLWFLKKWLNTSRIAFPGKPGAKIHITGILETRVLDYDNLILLSVNEGVWPAGKQSPSFIPFHLRKEFGLPVIATLDEMYGYHFFRLLQRARNVHVGYLSLSDNIKSGIGEKSRFLLQLEYEFKHPIDKMKVIGDVRLISGNPPVIPKKEGILDKLNKYLLTDSHKKKLSPSAINTFIDCQLRFVYQYLLKLRDEDEKSDLSEPRLFGKILHEAMELIYTKLFKNGMVSIDAIKSLLKDNDLHESIILEVLETDANKSFEGVNVQLLTAKDRMVLKVVQNYVKLILRTDLQYAPFQILGTEEGVDKVEKITIGNEEFSVCLGGIIDRLDQKGDVIRVIDYKSGQPQVKVKELKELIDSGHSKRPKEMLQALIYAYLQVGRSKKSNSIMPGLYAVRHLSNGVLTPNLFLGGEQLINQSQYYDAIELMIKEVLEDLFNPEVDFKPTDNLKNCEYCSFNLLCQRV